MEVDGVDEQTEEDGYDEDVYAVWQKTQCYERGGYGHLAKVCPSKGMKGKGKGKEGGKIGFKGKGKHGHTFGKNGGGKGGGAKGGKGTGYQGQCWRCWQVGHKAAECVANIAECGAAEENVEDAIGGVWTIGGVDVMREEPTKKEHVVEDKEVRGIQEGPPGSCRDQCCEGPSQRKMGAWMINMTSKNRQRGVR